MQELRNTIAVKDKQIIELKEEVNFLKGELKGIGHRRTTLELNTEDKIRAAFNQQFGAWKFYLSTFLIPSLQLLHHALFLALIGGLGWLIMQGHKLP